MYAIFEDGSRQFMVEEGDIVEVDFREAEPGSAIEFDRVLLFNTGTEARIGQPVVAGAKVVAEVLEETSKKVTIQKFRRRKNYRRFKGHRQPYLAVGIAQLVLAGWQRPAAPEKPASEESGSEESAKE